MGPASAPWIDPEREREIASEISRQRPRLRRFIRSRLADAAEGEDILQDVLAELVEAYRALRPIEQVGAWLVRVASNRITDHFRRKKTLSLEALRTDRGEPESEGELTLDDLLPAPRAGPEAAYARSVLLEELTAALEELPAEQRDVFVAHEIEGRSFREIADETGVALNTLLSRKRYAVLHLRERLGEIYQEFNESEGWES